MTDAPTPPGLQHERTALAWERTAISMMVAGVLLARYAAEDAHWVIAFVGLAHTGIGAGILVWADLRYENFDDPSNGTDVVHPAAARLLGIATITLTGAGLLLAIILTFV